MNRADRGRGAKRRLGLIGAIVAGALACGAVALGLAGIGPLALLLDGEEASAHVGDGTLGPHAEIVRPAPVIEVAVRPGTEVRAFPGTIHPARSSALAFRVGGPLVDLPVREGDVVAAGTLLALIDPRDFVLAADELSARLDAAEAAQRLAELNHRRRARLVERGAVSRADLDQAVAERDRTAAEVASLTQSLAMARAALEDTRLIAPFDGRVARLHVELHDYVNARQPAIAFHDTSGVDLVVNLPETIIPRIPDILEIEVELSGQPGSRHAATIREIASEQATETGTYRTALRLSGLDGPAPFAGLSGTAFVRFANGASLSPHEILVPSSAVFAGDNGGEFVWVVEGDPPAVAQRPITVVGMVGDQVRLVGGLTEGERIVAYGVHFLQDGQRVRPSAPPQRAAGGQL